MVVSLTGSRRYVLALLIFVVGFAIYASPANAHRAGESYVYLNVTETSLAGRFEIALHHMSQATTLDADGDGVVTEAEALAKADEIRAYLTPRLRFFDGDDAHPVVLGEIGFVDAGFETFIVSSFDAPTIDLPPEHLDVEYRFLFDEIDPSHRGLLIIESNTRSGIAENEAQHSLIFETRRRTPVVSGRRVVVGPDIRPFRWTRRLPYRADRLRSHLVPARFALAVGVDLSARRVGTGGRLWRSVLGRREDGHRIYGRALGDA